MYSNIENDHFKIYYQIVELGDHVYGGENDQKSLIQECIDFQKNWNVKIGAENISTQCKSNFMQECESIRRKLLCNTKICVVLGRTSSGKSTLINALLAEEVLPTSYGETSNCFVEISASPTNTNYLVIDNERRRIEDNQYLNNLLSDDHLESGSRINMYYDKNKCNLLKDDVVIIDTPGYDSGIFDNDLMDEFFNGADIVVLVVNAISGINKEDEKLLKNYKAALEKLNLVIIYNFWDVVNPKDQNGKIKKQFLDKAKTNLKAVLNIDDTSVDSFIFFVSSSERISIFTSHISENLRPLLEERNISFQRFFDHLNKEISESLCKRKNKYLQTLKCMLETSFNQCQSCIAEMHKNSFNLEQNITNELKNIEGLNGIINQIISKRFNESFENLIIESLKLVETDKTKTVKMENNPINFEYEIISFPGNCKDTIDENYRKLLEEITEKNLEFVKSKLIDFLKHEDENVNSFRKTIFNEIYFPFYFNLNDELNNFNIKTFKNSLNEIKRLKKILSGVTAGVTGFLLAAGAVTVGVLIPVIGLAEIAVGIGVAAGGAVGGGAIGAGAALGGIKLTKLPFRLAWKKYEAAIKYDYNLFELELINKYSTFMDDMMSNIINLIEPIEKKANKLQNKFNNIEEKLQLLRTTQ